MAFETLLIADRLDDTVTAKSQELAGVANVLAPDRPDQAVYVLTGDTIADAASGLSRKTGVAVIALEGGAFRFPNPEALAETICAMPEMKTVRHICFLHTPGGCQAAAKVAVKTGAACVSAVENIHINNSDIVFERALMNGRLHMETRPLAQQIVITVMPGAFAPPEDTAAAKPHVVCRQATAPNAGDRFVPRKLTKAEETDTGLDRAAIIVAAGRGIGEEENLAMIHALARTLPNAAVGASRPLCDMKWLPYAHQVGATGKTVAPKLYFACGISGAQQHVQGMKDSQCIVAVNTDPNAAIFAVADFCIVADLTQFIPAFIEAYQAFLHPAA